VPADALRLALQPDCRLLRSRHPVMRMWQRGQHDAPGADDAEPPGGDDLLLVRRGAAGVEIERLPAAQHAWLSAVAAGATLGAALGAALELDPGFDVAAAVAQRIADGTLALRAAS
jgi:hypothetical protein